MKSLLTILVILGLAACARVPAKKKKKDNPPTTSQSQSLNESGDQGEQEEPSGEDVQTPEVISLSDAPVGPLTETDEDGFVGQALEDLQYQQENLENFREERLNEWFAFFEQESISINCRQVNHGSNERCYHAVKPLVEAYNSENLAPTPDLVPIKSIEILASRLEQTAIHPSGAVLRVHFDQTVESWEELLNAYYESAQLKLKQDLMVSDNERAFDLSTRLGVGVDRGEEKSGALWWKSYSLISVAKFRQGLELLELVISLDESSRNSDSETRFGDRAIDRIEISNEASGIIESNGFRVVKIKYDDDPVNVLHQLVSLPKSGGEPLTQQEIILLGSTYDPKVVANEFQKSKRLKLLKKRTDELTTKLSNQMGLNILCDLLTQRGRPNVNLAECLKGLTHLQEAFTRKVLEDLQVHTLVINSRQKLEKDIGVLYLDFDTDPEWMSMALHHQTSAYLEEMQRISEQAAELNKNGGYGTMW